MLAKLKFMLVAVAVLALGLGTAQAQTPPVELKVGPASMAGIVSFVLGTTANGDSLPVEAIVAGAMTASAKGDVVAAAVAAADPTGSWYATNVGGTLSFVHLIGGAWKNVDLITGFNDTTGSGANVNATETAVSFTLSLDPASVAYGYDGMGEPSYFTVTVTDTLSWTRVLQGGETPQVLLDLLQAFLAAQAGEGVTVTRVSETALTIALRYESSAINWQVTDLGLQSGTTGEVLRVSDSATLIRKVQ